MFNKYFTFYSETLRTANLTNNLQTREDLGASLVLNYTICRATKQPLFILERSIPKRSEGWGGQESKKNFPLVREELQIYHNSEKQTN